MALASACADLAAAAAALAVALAWALASFAASASGMRCLRVARSGASVPGQGSLQGTKAPPLARGLGHGPDARTWIHG